MLILGLAGKAGAGKDTVANYLVKRYGFAKFSFSDALYQEVADAFMLPDMEILRNRESKEAPHPFLKLNRCQDPEFRQLVTQLVDQENERLGVDKFLYPDGQSWSPRQILQWWGTDYRRAQNPNYWVERAEIWLGRTCLALPYPEHRPQYFVNTSVRFPNERYWIRSFPNGQVWHIRRDGLDAANAHVSEEPLPVLPPERGIWNNDTITRLHNGVELLLSTQAQFVRVEPMEPTA